jgi:hypothetical protein
MDKDEYDKCVEILEEFKCTSSSYEDCFFDARYFIEELVKDNQLTSGEYSV